MICGEPRWISHVLNVPLTEDRRAAAIRGGLGARDGPRSQLRLISRSHNGGIIFSLGGNMSAKIDQLTYESHAISIPLSCYHQGVSNAPPTEQPTK